MLKKTPSIELLYFKIFVISNKKAVCWNPEPVSGGHEQILIYVFSKLRQSWNPQLEVESANCKRNSQIVSGFRKL